MNRHHATPWLFAIAAGAMSLICGSVSAQQPAWARHAGRMELTSADFSKDNPLPAGNIYNDDATGTTYNVCSASGAAGGDESPQLSWHGAPPETRSFVVVLYDTTAAFTHWGLYGIAAHTHALPQGAGVANSPYGSQINNDFGDQSYDGPCPPFGYAPDVHHYVFTVYALDIELEVVSASANFPANGEALYQALIKAGTEGHILATGELVALNEGSLPP